jgi:hypothetical protein
MCTESYVGGDEEVEEEEDDGGGFERMNCLTTYLWEGKFTEVVVICSFSLSFSGFVVRLYIVFHNEIIYHVPIRWFST